MNKKYYIFIFSTFLILSTGAFLINSSYSDTENTSCNYNSEVQQCFAENFPEGGVGFPESIEDFVCLQSNNKEEIVYQIVLDAKFKEIDEEIETYLQGLDLEKDKYFGPDKQESYLEGVQQIYDDFKIYGKYWQKYLKLCSPSSGNESILKETMSCLGGEISNLGSDNFFEDTTCMSLATSKLDIYKEVAFDIMKYNKFEIREDNRKTHIQEQREKYDMVTDLFIRNLSYMERIWQKWVSKTKNPH